MAMRPEKMPVAGHLQAAGHMQMLSKTRHLLANQLDRKGIAEKALQK